MAIAVAEHQAGSEMHDAEFDPVRSSLGVGATDGEAEPWYFPPQLPPWLSVMFYGVVPIASEFL